MNNNNTTDKVIDILNTFEIESYKTEGKPIRNGNKMKDELEFDIIGHIHDKYGFIIEVTTQKQDNKKKIQKFLVKCNRFLNIAKSHSAKSIFSDIGIPSERINDFDNIIRNGEWRFIYMGLNDEFSKGAHNNFNGLPGNEYLYIFNKEHYEYLLFLKDRLGKYGKYELLHVLKISLDKDHTVSVRAIKYTNRRISKEIENVDLYVFVMPVEDLLKMARVARYGSLDSWIPEVGTNYQRLLNIEKLKKISAFLNDGKATFPNAITVVLSCDFKEDKKIDDIVELSIPIQYSSIEVIDGQHRLFAFSKVKTYPDDKLIVVGLKFNTDKQEEIRRWSARTFVEINKEQAKVPTELIYLIQYNSMGEKTPEAMAAKILIDLNNKNNGPLERIFRTRPFMTRNRIGGKPVRIVTIVNELKELFNYKDVLNEYNINDKDLGEIGKIMLERYFSYLKHIFENDWSDKDSLIFTTKYMAAFCRLFIDLRCKQRLDDDKIKERLCNLRDNLRNISTEGKYFSRDNEKIPKVGGKESASVQSIYEFLKEHCESTINNKV